MFLDGLETHTGKVRCRLHGAGLGGVEVEPYQALGGGADLPVTFHVLVSLMVVVAALVLKGHVHNPGVVDCLVIVSLEVTILREDLLAKFGGSLD